MKKILFTALLCTCLTAPAWADPTFGFYKITNNGNVDVSSQLSVVVSSAGSNQVLFKFFNNVGIASSITDIYFDDGTLLGIASISDSGDGVAFTAPAVPKDLSGGNDISPKFDVTKGFSADSVEPIAPMGVDSASEWVGITFNLINGKTLGDTIAALGTGELRIGLHVQSIGTTGGSDSYVNVNVVPVPGAVLLGFLGLGYAGMRLRREV